MSEVLTFLTNVDEVELQEQIDSFGGSVEVTSGNPTKSNTVLTVDPDNSDDINVYSAGEVDYLIGKVQQEIVDQTTIQNMIDNKFNSIVNGNGVEY